MGRAGRPDDEVHAFINDLERPDGTFLYGRRMYETMRAWETTPATADTPQVMRDFAEIWRAADKVVFSRTLEAVSSARTRIEREFEADDVRRMQADAERDLGIGGPHLAAAAFRAGLVDELQLSVAPIVVGGGTAFLPGDVNLRLELLDERRFGNGMVHLRYSSGSGRTRIGRTSGTPAIPVARCDFRRREEDPDQRTLRERSLQRWAA